MRVLAMAARIDAPGKTTTDLADRSHSEPISMGEPRWGDIVVNATGTTTDGYRPRWLLNVTG